MFKNLTLFAVCTVLTNSESYSDIGNGYIDVSDIHRQSVANLVANSDHQLDADIENDDAVPDIRPDSANEQDSDGSELNSEKKVGNSLLDLLPVEILEKVFLYVMKISNFFIPRSCLLDIQPRSCNNTSVGKIQTRSHRISA